jgi:hypothetical protein
MLGRVWMNVLPFQCKPQVVLSVWHAVASSGLESSEREQLSIVSRQIEAIERSLCGTAFPALSKSYKRLKTS